MWSEIIKYITVLASSMVKFLFGPISGIAMDLHYVETFVLTVVGMMLSVVIFSFLGEKIRIFYFKYINKNYNPYSFRNKIKIWKNWGMKGVAFLTPVLLSPIGGTLIAVAFGESRKRIFAYMLVSAVLWGLAITFIAYKIGSLDFTTLFQKSV
jgi:hypothetical protein